MSFNEKLSYTEHVVTTPATDFSIGFKDYGKPSDTVEVTVDGIPAADAGYTVFRKNAMTVALEPEVTSGIVRLQRETNIDSSFHRFTAGAKFVAANMDANFEQILHSQQETRDGFTKLASDVYPLVNGLEGALEKADAASKAAQEAAELAAKAAEAAEEAAQTTRSASQVIDNSGLTQQVINDGVDSTSDLLTIPTPKNGSRVYVKSIGTYYTYFSDSNQVHNGVTVVNNWVMDTQDFYYASWFAEKGKKEDQSSKLQLGYDYAVSKSKPFVVDAAFYVNPPTVAGNKTAIWIRSNSTLLFTPDSSIEMLPNSSQGYDILRVQDIINYTIVSPKLIGDAKTHTGTQGEWGYGLTIYQSENGLITDPDIKYMWGDCLYIGTQWGIDGKFPKNIKVVRARLDGCRRNGISVTSGIDILIDQPLVMNTRGVAPQAGIDVETEESGSTLSILKNVVINNATLIDNYSPINVHTGKPNRDVDVRFTGVTQIIDNSTEVRTFYVYRPYVPVGQLQRGQVYFENLRWFTQRNSVDFALYIPETGIDLIIDKLEFSKNVQSFVLNYIETALDGQPFGGFNIRSIINPNLRWAQSKYFMANSTFLKSNIRIEHSNNTRQVFNDSAHYVFYTPTANVDSYAIWEGWSDNTLQMPNIIWQNPSIDTTGNTAIYMQTSQDFRRLKIGLFFGTTRIGQGCNISGLKIMVDGILKTKARTTQAGAWIEFQNSATGDTQVFSSYGNWIFS